MSENTCRLNDNKHECAGDVTDRNLCRRHAIVFDDWLLHKGGSNIYDYPGGGNYLNPVKLRDWKRKKFVEYLNLLEKAQVIQIVGGAV